MAKLNLNSALGTVRGTIDGFVYKTINGRTFLTKNPVFRRRKWSGQQKRGHGRMALATDYAKASWADPAAKAFYEEVRRARKAWRAFSLATGDFLNAPEIHTIEVLPRNKGGHPVVRIGATDDIGVVRVEVTIRSGKGALLERGAASAKDGRWRYEVQSWRGSETVEIEVQAYDRPTNCTVAKLRFAGAQ